MSPKFTNIEEIKKIDKNDENIDTETALDKLNQEIDTLDKLQEESFSQMSDQQLVEKLVLMNNMRNLQQKDLAKFNAIDLQVRMELAKRLWEKTDGSAEKKDNCIDNLADALRSDMKVEDIKLWRGDEPSLLTDLFTREVPGEPNAFKVEFYGIKKFELGINLADIIPTKYQVISLAKDYRLETGEEKLSTKDQWGKVNTEGFKQSKYNRIHRMLFQGKPAYCKLTSDGEKVYVPTFSGDIVYGHQEHITDANKTAEIQNYEIQQLKEEHRERKLDRKINDMFEQLNSESTENEALSAEEKYAKLQQILEDQTDLSAEEKAQIKAKLNSFDPEAVDPELYKDLPAKQRKSVQKIVSENGKYIIETAYRYGIPPSLITSIIFLESRGNSKAINQETIENPQVNKRKQARYELYKTNYTKYGPKLISYKDFYASKGLGQIQGQTAITLMPELSMDLDRLYDPKVNIDLIGKVIAKYKIYCGLDPISLRKAYVSGSMTKRIDEKYIEDFVSIYEPLSSLFGEDEFKRHEEEGESELYGYKKYFEDLQKAPTNQFDWTGGNFTTIEDYRIIKEGIESKNIGGQVVEGKPALLQRLEWADKAYFASTGQHIKINDDFRTNIDQKNIKIEKGQLAAEIGRSFHELGQAIDINNANEVKPFLELAGIKNIEREDWHFSIGEVNSIEDALSITEEEYNQRIAKHLNHQETPVGNNEFLKNHSDTAFIGDSLSVGYTGYSEIRGQRETGKHINQIAEDLPEVLEQQNPQKLVILAGTNDISDMSVKDVYTKIIEMIEEARSHNSNIKIWIGTLPPLENRGEEVTQKIKDLNTLIKKLKEDYKNNIDYIDFYSALAENNKFKTEFRSDGIHPNDDGYALMRTMIDQAITTVN